MLLLFVCIYYFVAISFENPTKLLASMHWLRVSARKTGGTTSFGSRHQTFYPITRQPLITCKIASCVKIACNWDPRGKLVTSGMHGGIETICRDRISWKYFYNLFVDFYHWYSNMASRDRVYCDHCSQMVSRRTKREHAQMLRDQNGGECSASDWVWLSVSLSDCQG